MPLDFFLSSYPMISYNWVRVLGKIKQVTSSIFEGLSKGFKGNINICKHVCPTLGSVTYLTAYVSLSLSQHEVFDSE